MFVFLALTTNLDLTCTYLYQARLHSCQPSLVHDGPCYLVECGGVDMGQQQVYDEWGLNLCLENIKKTD